MITLGTTAAVAYLSTGGSKAPTTPPIQASSSDEEKFIKYVDRAGWGGVCGAWLTATRRDFIAAAEKEAPSKH